MLNLLNFRQSEVRSESTWSKIELNFKKKIRKTQNIRLGGGPLMASEINLDLDLIFLSLDPDLIFPSLYLDLDLFSLSSPTFRSPDQHLILPSVDLDLIFFTHRSRFWSNFSEFQS